ncbi:MAG: glycosyltransferase [Geodermatophilaceae bacterium]|nr:glycosyltransferase [Geodermatophilaceae bacterium]MDQ3465751.1 glycosyltransferase [Actinomycetota bacterium]
MLRVLHVTEAPTWGVFSLIKEFTREQSARGYDVHVLAPPRMLRLSGDVRQHDWSISRGRPRSYLRGVHELRRTIREVKPDIIHLHSFFGGLFGRLPVLSGLDDVAIVYQPHAWAFNMVELARVRLLVKAWERFAGRRTNVMVANCAEEVEEGRRAGIAGDGIPLGIALDTDHFTPVDEATRGHWRSELGVTTPGILLCLGRLAKQKGQDQLVAAWEANPLPDAELVLVGIDESASLEPLAPTQWGKTIRPVQSVHDVRPWLWACDVLVLPSRYEGSAVTVPEAMACGRTVVTTLVNGVREGVLEGPHPPAGAIVPLGAMEELLSQCARRLDDPELARAEGMAGRLRALDLFKTQEVVDRLDAAYQQARDTPSGWGR